MGLPVSARWYDVGGDRDVWAMRLVSFAPLFALLVWAAREDLRRRRVPNWLSFGLVLGGVCVSTLPWRNIPPGSALAGLAAGFGLSLVLYMLGAVGAGDVKLMAGVGAWIGPLPVLIVFAATAVIGMVLSFVVAARTGALVVLLGDGLRLGASLANGSARDLPHVRALSSAQPSRDRVRRLTLPRAVAIAAATIGTLLVRAFVSAQGGIS